MARPHYYSITITASVIRDAIRRLTIESMIGIMPNSGSSVEEVRLIRKKLSNKEFHSFLTSLSENDRLIKFAENLRNHVRCFYFRGFYRPHIQLASNEHRKIFEAIKEMKPAKVEQLIRAHYLNSKNRLVKYMNKSL